MEINRLVSRKCQYSLAVLAVTSIEQIQDASIQRYTVLFFGN